MPPDESSSSPFKGLGKEFEELKRHANALQSKGLQLAKIAESGCSNVAVYDTVFSLTVHLENKHPEVGQRISEARESGQFLRNVIHNENKKLASQLSQIEVLSSGTLTGITFSNVATRTLADCVIKFSDEEGKKLLGEQIQKLSKSFTSEQLDDLLRGMNENLPAKRTGAWDTFYSASTDRLSQAANSMRDILRSVIAKIATNAAVEKCKWYIAAKNADGKPEKSDRFRFLLFGPVINQCEPEEEGGMTRMVSEYIEHFEALQNVAHGSRKFSALQVRTAMEQIEELLFLVLTRAKNDASTPKHSITQKPNDPSPVS